MVLRERILKKHFYWLSSA